MADPKDTKPEVPPVDDEPVEVDPRVGLLIPLALRGQGAESVQFEGEDTVYVVEDDRIAGVVAPVDPEADAVDALGSLT